MTRIAVVTKSFAPDFDLCMALNRSVLENAPGTVEHHIIVPRSDLKLFNRLSGSRTHIRCELDLLPRSFVPIPFRNMSINLRRPFPPVRGWIQQQVIKLAAVAASNDDAILIADSDVEFVRPFTAEMFVQNGKVRFFRNPDAIDARLPRHMTWHRVARELLGLPAAKPPHPDYISSLIAWSPATVRRMLAQVASTTGRPWPTAIAGQIDFSECILYGVFVDSLGVQADTFASDDPLCLLHWEHAPLAMDGVADFVRSVRPTDVAAMIPSKSQTTPAVRDAVFTALRAAPYKGRGAQEPAARH